MDAECDVYYNQKAFDDAHLPYPKDNWTWDELLKDAKALTQKDAKGNVTRWGFVDDAARIEPWIYSTGGRWVDNSFRPARYAFNTPAFVKGLQFRADLIHKYRVMPDPASMNAIAGSASDLFVNGGVAMFFSGFWYTPLFRDIKGFKWDMAVIPKGPGGKRGFAEGGSGYGILSTCKNKKAAWELVKYLAGPEGQDRMAGSGLVFPALKSVAKSKYFLDNQPPLNKGAIIKMVPYGVLEPQALNWAEIVETVCNPVLDRVWIGTETPQGAVSLMAEKLKDKALITR
jgi:multiple sugar transport system substrate-binding protein